MEQQDLQLNRYAWVLWKGKWVILLATLVALGGALLFAERQPTTINTYQAVATIMVEPVASPVGLPATAQATSVDRGVNTQIELIKSRNIMERALAKLQKDGERVPPSVTAARVEALRNSISVRPIPTTNLLEVRARASSPALAEERADAVVESFIDYIKDERTRTIEDALHDLASQKLGPGPTNGSQSVRVLERLDLGNELANIADLVRNSAAGLSELRKTDDPVGVESALDLERPQIDKATAELDAVSREFRNVLADLSGATGGAASGGGSLGAERPLSLEADRLSITAADLDMTYKELSSIRIEIAQKDPSRAFSSIASQADQAEASLRVVIKEISQINRGDPDVTRQVVALEEYTTTVAADLNKMSSELRSLAKGERQLTEGSRLAMQGQVLSHTLGLKAASSEFAKLRSEPSLDIQSYGRVVGIEGRIETAVRQIADVGEELESTAKLISLQDGLTEILDWVRGSGDGLQAVSKNVLTLEASPASQGERDIAARARNEITGIIITLDVASGQLQSLVSGIADPLLEARLKSLAARLSTAQTRVQGSAERLEAITGVGDVTLANRVAAVHQRVDDSINVLRTAQESRQVGNHVASAALSTESSILVQVKISDAARSLDVSSRQLDAILRGSTDPLLSGELAALSEQLSAAHEEVEGISQRLANSRNMGSNGVSRTLGMAQSWLDDSADNLASASLDYQSALAGSPEGVDYSVVASVEGQVSRSAAVLSRIADDLNGLQSAESDPFRYGQLVVLQGRISEAELRSNEVAVQLQQVLGGRGPGYVERRQLKQQLELSLLQPQETGITIVDSAVSPQVSSSSNSFFDQIRTPLAAVAGFLLGSIAVLVRAQLDGRVRSQDHLRERLGMTSVAVVPKARIRRRYRWPNVSDRKTSPFAEALQVIGTDLADHINKGVQCFLVTSTSASEGKTMLAVNLARVLSRHGHRVLLVDANLRKPEVATLLGIPGEEGLANALAELHNPIGYVVEVDGISVIPGGKTDNNPVELLASQSMTMFLEEAKHQYDVVVVDGPPVAGFAETKVLAKGVEGLILVVRAGAVSLEDAEMSKEELETTGVPLVSGVLNFAGPEECDHLKHESYVRGGGSWLDRLLGRRR